MPRKTKRPALLTVRAAKRALGLPDDDLALMRLPRVLDLYPVSRSEWWKGIAEGPYPKPVRIGKRMSAWRAGSIRTLLAAVDDDDAA
jgi:prophage regulatory protein